MLHGSALVDVLFGNNGSSCEEGKRFGAGTLHGSMLVGCVRLKRERPRRYMGWPILVRAIDGPVKQGVLAWDGGVGAVGWPLCWPARLSRVTCFCNARLQC